MANAAKIEEGPAGTPTQAWWDGFIGGIENCPDTKTIERYTKKLNGYIKKMNKAIADGEKEIYDATIGKFNECKKEILDYLNDKKKEAEEQINEAIEGKEDNAEKAADDLEKEIEDLTLKSASLTIETEKGEEVESNEPKDLSGVIAWVHSVTEYVKTQRVTTLQRIIEIKNTIERIKKKYDPIVAAVKWWPETIIKLTTYMTKRLGDITKAITSITNITPPSFPSQINQR